MNIEKELAALRRMTPRELRCPYRKCHPEGQWRHRDGTSEVLIASRGRISVGFGQEWRTSLVDSRHSACDGRQGRTGEDAGSASDQAARW